MRPPRLWHVVTCSSAATGPTLAAMPQSFLAGWYSVAQGWLPRLRAAGCKALMFHLPHGLEYRRELNGDIVRNERNAPIGYQSAGAPVHRHRQGNDHITNPWEFATAMHMLRSELELDTLAFYIGPFEPGYMAFNTTEKYTSIQPYLYAGADWLMVDGSATYVEGSPRGQELVRLDSHFPHPCGVEAWPSVGLEWLRHRPMLALTAFTDHFGWDHPSLLPRSTLTNECLILDNRSRNEEQALARATEYVGLGFCPSAAVHTSPATCDVLRKMCEDYNTANPPVTDPAPPVVITDPIPLDAGAGPTN